MVSMTPEDKEALAYMVTGGCDLARKFLKIEELNGQVVEVGKIQRIIDERIPFLAAWLKDSMKNVR